MLRYEKCCAIEPKFFGIGKRMMMSFLWGVLACRKARTASKIVATPEASSLAPREAEWGALS
jgi:hypothetical protein